MKSNFECVFVLSRFNFPVLQKYCITTKAIFLFLCNDNTIGALLLKYSRERGSAYVKLYFMKINMSHINLVWFFIMYMLSY